MLANFRSQITCRLLCLGWLALCGSPVGVRAAEGPGVPVAAESRITFELTDQESQVPERFRLTAHEFPSTAKYVRKSGETTVYDVTFPSPVETPFPENNTVHGLYFQPPGPGPFPGVVVLHILGGDFVLSQTIANHLSRQGVAALFIKLPYYGERRPPNSSRRMISKVPAETVEGMSQGVVDIRRAVAWLRARPEIDDEDLGVTGISLGGLMSSLSAAGEPRIRKVGIQLAGGHLAQTIWDTPIKEVAKETSAFRAEWERIGGTRETFIEALKPIDPVTHGHLLRGRRVLMLAARQDEIFPESSTLALWESIGKEPQIVWLDDAGHYTAILYILRETERLGEFFKQPLSEPAKTVAVP